MIETERSSSSYQSNLAPMLLESREMKTDENTEVGGHWTRASDAAGRIGECCRATTTTAAAASRRRLSAESSQWNRTGLVDDDDAMVYCRSKSFDGELVSSPSPASLR